MSVLEIGEKERKEIKEKLEKEICRELRRDEGFEYVVERDLEYLRSNSIYETIETGIRWTRKYLDYSEFKKLKKNVKFIVIIEDFEFDYVIDVERCKYMMIPKGALEVLVKYGDVVVLSTFIMYVSKTEVVDFITNRLESIDKWFKKKYEKLMRELITVEDAKAFRRILWIFGRYSSEKDKLKKSFDFLTFFPIS